MRRLLAFVIPLAALAAQAQTPAPTDPIIRLQQDIDNGRVALTFEDGFGYLRSVLRALGVSHSSQTLLFSKTSLEIFHVSPQTPRALYFNDDVYVGFINQGPAVEIAAIDTKTQAPVFYTLEQEQEGSPQFKREDVTCLHCHVVPEQNSNLPGGAELSPPRLFMRSHFTDVEGNTFQVVKLGSQQLIFPISDQTSFDKRWGGWYVTGTHGTQLHMGNMFAPKSLSALGPDLTEYAAHMDRSTGANVTDLRRRFDTQSYLTPHSDIVALMVLGHQVSLQNRMADAARVIGDVDVSRVAEPLLKAMLFVNEAPLTGPVAGTTTFAAEFSARGPRDSLGRSLRDLDLNRRLLRYPLSYLIYSESFNALPAGVKGYVYRRLREVLTAKDSNKDFDHLTPTDRAAILEILEETKPDFAAERR